MVGQWTFETLRLLNETQTVQLRGAAVLVSVSRYGASSLVNGMRIGDTWATEAGADYAGPVYLPPVYDTERRLVPYRFPLDFANGADLFRASVQQLEVDPAMYSPTHHLELRFLPLSPLGSTEPAQLTVDGAAVLLRISSYNPGAACIDGLNIFDALRTGPIFDVKQDWPPMYDPAWRVIPYRHTFRFSSQGGQPIQGAFTVVDLVPNR